jgi:SAM-dependent methyltransferase
MKPPEGLTAPYDAVAEEYYDPVQHPTCANFSELSSHYLSRRIQDHGHNAKRILEVGAGRSTVAPILNRQLLPLERLTLLDQSAGMLEYSRPWAKHGSHLVVRDACDTGFADDSFDLIVSALGDPYNCYAFWREVARLLVPTGICLFTTPASEWSMRFRPLDTMSHAEFLTAAGVKVFVPSTILDHDEQVNVVSSVGLRVIEAEGLSATQLSTTRSPKLMVSDKTIGLPIVRGFTFQKV